MRYFISYDPKPNLEKLSCNVLALNGGKDIQVLPKSNLAGIKAALANSKSKSYEVKEIPGAKSSYFKSVLNVPLQEYGDANTNL